MKNKPENEKFLPNIFGGFSLIEMIVYIAIMTIIVTTFIQSFVVILKSNKNAFADMNIRNSGYGAMQTMIGEIRKGSTLDIADSNFASGTALINEVDASSTLTVVKFSVDSTSKVLNFYSGATSTALSLIGPLTSNDTQVSQLIFTPINTGSTTALRIQLNMQTTIDNRLRSEWFYSTVVLRRSY